MAEVQLYQKVYAILQVYLYQLLSSSYTNNGLGTGAAGSTLTGLTSGTTYYVSAYATNSASTSYGTDTSFRTVL